MITAAAGIALILPPATKKKISSSRQQFLFRPPEKSLKGAFSPRQNTRTLARPVREIGVRPHRTAPHRTALR